MEYEIIYVVKSTIFHSVSIKNQPYKKNLPFEIKKDMVIKQTIRE